MAQPILSVRNLVISLPTQRGDLYAVNGVNFSVNKGETYALLGESGCGKSITALSILQLLPDSARVGAESEIWLEQENLLSYSSARMRHIRGRRIAMIFQEPMTSLNPVLSVGRQIEEMLVCHTNLSRRARRQRVIELLDMVDIPHPVRRANEYPHQLSGGMKQRVMIAMALAAQPNVLIADEPTTALDVTTQARLLALLKRLQTQLGMTMVLITHDLGVVKTMADHVGVMYAGHLVEQAPAAQFFSAPLHPYSRKLFESLPDLHKKGYQLNVLEGSVPPLTESFAGCRFVARCPYAMSVCHTQPPRWYQRQAAEVRCHLYQESQITWEATEEPSARSKQRHRGQPILAAAQLKVHFPIRKGLFRRVVDVVPAVDGVDFTLAAGQTLALVGESGSGKTTLGRSITRLVQPTSGSIVYKQQNIARLSHRQFSRLRQEIQLIFQDPFSAMNPRMLVGDVIQEGMRRLSKPDRAARTQELLAEVGLPEDSIERYPHEFSGGQRQRICIARALAVNPQLIICDEPTSALDVSVQAQILNLLQRLQVEKNLSYLFISHNLAVVAYLADYIAVMYQGKIVEYGTAEAILTQPQHEYTQRLLGSVLVVG